MNKTETILELTLALAYLSQVTIHDRILDTDFTFAYKNYDYAVLTELSKRGYIDIGDKPSRTNKLWFTDQGTAYAKELLKKFGIEE